MVIYWKAWWAEVLSQVKWKEEDLTEDQIAQYKTLYTEGRSPAEAIMILY